MKKVLAISAAAILTAFASHVVLEAAGQKFHEAVIVRGTAPHTGRGDLALTFSAPVSLPGISLAPGTYVFQRGDANAMLVRDSTGRPYKWLLTVPAARTTPTNNYSVLLDRETAPDAPPRIVAIFAPGESTGHGFVYAKR